MAAKILGIKLEVDATQGAKLAKVYEDTAVAAKNTEGVLKNIETARYAAIDKQKEAYARLSDSIVRANEVISRTGNTGSGIALATRELKKYNETLEETKKALLALPKSPTLSGTGLSDPEQRGPYNDGRKYTTIADAREAVAKESLKRIEEAEQAHANKVQTINNDNRVYKTIAESRETAKKAELANIEAQEKAANARLVAMDKATAALRSQVVLRPQGNFNYSVGNSSADNAARQEKEAAIARANAYTQYIATVQERERFLSSIIGNEQTTRTSLTRQGIADQERMYAGLFDQIAARERAVTEAARARIASQFSALGAQGQANNSRIEASSRLTAGMTSAGQVPVQEAAARQAAVNARNLELFNASLRQQETSLQNSVALQTAIQLHGINSVQAERVRANQQAIALEEQRQATLSRIQSRVSSGTITPAAGITEAARANTLYTNAIRETIVAAGDSEVAHRNLFLRIGEGIGLWRLWNFAINTVISSLKSIPQLGIELESTRSSLLSTMGGTAGLGSAMAALDIEAERTGINIKILRENFRGFQASTSLAGASVESTWKMFTNLNSVITSLHLSTDKAQGIFLAMAQIFNKGKVQSEELVKQLGNLLPGAFASFAASMGVTTLQLSKNMKAGAVYAQDTVEQFTTFMKNRFAASFGLASEGLNANVGRMQTSFIHLGEALYGLSSGGMLSFTKTAASIANNITSLINGTSAYSNLLLNTFRAAYIASLAVMINYVAQLRIVTSTLAAYTGTATLAQAATVTLSGAMTGLKAVMSFLSSPGVIIAGITAIISHMNNLKEAADRGKQSFRELLDESLKLQEAKENPVLKLSIEVDKDETVIKAKEAIETVQQQINTAKNRIAILDKSSAGSFNPIINAQKEDAKAVLAQLEETQFQRTKYYEIVRRQTEERLSAEKNNTVSQIDNLEALNKAYADSSLDMLNHSKNVEDAMKYGRERFLKDNETGINAAKQAMAAAKKSVDEATDPSRESTKVIDLSAQQEIINTASATLKNYYAAAEREGNLAVERLKASQESATKKLAKPEEAYSKKALELELKNIKDTAIAKQEAIKASIEANQGLYDREKISFNTYIADKARYQQKGYAIEIESLAKQKQAIEAELSKQVSKRTASYSPAQISEAKDFVASADHTATGHTIDIQVASMEEYNAKVAASRKILEEVNKTKLVSNSTDLRSTELKEQLKVLDNELLKLQRESVNASEEKAKAEFKYTEQALANANALILKDKERREGRTAEVVGKEFSITNKKVIEEFQQVGASANSTPAQKATVNQAQAILAHNKSLDMARAELDMAQKQENALAAVSEGYRNVGVTAADVLGSQLNGIQQVVTAMNNYSNTTESLAKKQLELKQQMQRTALMDDSPEKTKQYEVDAATQIELDKQVRKNKLSSLSLISSATSSMFKQGSKEAAVANSMAIAFSLAQQIRELAALPVKGAQVVLNAGASGDGYTAIARMAAVAATVAALISSVGGAFSGMSGGKTSSTAMPESTGQGTTLGDSKTESASLVNTLQILNDINYKSYSELRKLNDSVSSITNNIIRVATLNAQGKLSTASPIAPTGGFTAMGKVVQGIVDITTAYMTLGLSQILKKLPVIGGILSGIDDFITGGLFGKTTAKITGQGYLTGIQSAAKILTGVAASLQEYYTVEETTKSWFSKSTKIYDVTKKAGKAAISVFTDLFKSVAETTKTLAEQVGTGFVDAIYRYKFPAIKIDVKGKTSEQIITKLNAVMSAQLDKMTSKVFGGVFGDLQALGEGMFATVSRLYTEKAVLTRSFTQLGKDIPTDTIAFIRLADALTQASSNADTAAARMKEFATQEQTFYTSFTSAAKQSEDNLINLASGLNNVFTSAFSVDQAAKVKKFTETVAKQGGTSGSVQVESFSTLRDIFLDTYKATGSFSDALVKLKGSIDLSSKAGIAAYATMNKLTEISKTYADALAEVQKPLNDQIATLKDTIDARSQEQLLASLATTTDLAEQKRLTVKIQKLIMDKYNTELNSIKTVQSAYVALGEYVKGLLLGNLSTLTPKQKFVEAEKQYKDTLTSIASSDKAVSSKAIANLQNVSNSYLTQAQAYLGYTVAYGTIFNQVVATAQAFADQANTTVSDNAEAVTLATQELAGAAIIELQSLSTTLATAAIKAFQDLLDKTNVEQSKVPEIQKSPLEILYDKLAGSQSKAETANTTKQISAYNAGYKTQGQAGADRALSLEQDRERLQADLSLLKSQQKAEQKKSKKLQDKELLADLKTKISATEKAIKTDSTQLKTLGFKASGGIVDTDLTVVGEKGMELLNLPRGTNVSSNNTTNSIISQSNKQVVELNEAMLAELKAMNERLAYLERKVAIGKPNLVRG